MLERTPQYLAEKAASKIALFCRGIHYILIQLPWNFRIVWCRSFCLMPCGVFILRCWPTGIHFSIVALRWHLYDQRTYKSALVCKSIFYRFRCLRTKKAARNQNGEISWKQWKLWPNIWKKFTKPVECSRGRNDQFEEARQFGNSFKQTASGALANQIRRS